MDKTNYYIADYEDKEGSVSILLTVKEAIGSLSQTLNIFRSHGVNLLHIESRASTIQPDSYDFIINADNLTGGLDKCLEELKCSGNRIAILPRFGSSSKKSEYIWFPRKMVDLDRFCTQILSYGADLDADHPGFTDPVYRERRKYFADIAFNYRHGQKIPYVEYSEQEISTWRTVYDSLTNLYPTHAVDEFNYVFPLLVNNCGFCRDKIPQLQDVSDFMHDCTGFRIRPIAGLLSSRDFLAGLAFRVFHATQYIRHHSRPLYTPEPDICHEILGHVPLFCDMEFARLSQEIGIASLGASDDDIKRLATCYWFTIEFGICRQNNKNKAYGAGLLSSFGELEYCLSEKPELRPFNPEVTGEQEYPITEYQPVYYVADSFESATDKIIEFARKIPKPFTLRYNAYNETVEVVDTKYMVKDLVKDIRCKLQIVEDSVSRSILT